MKKGVLNIYNQIEYSLKLFNIENKIKISINFIIIKKIHLNVKI